MTQQVAVITGAAQGIGRRTAELLAEQGYKLAVIDLRQPEELVTAIEKKGGEIFAYAGNIADESVVAAFAEAVFQRYSRADVLVNNMQAKANYG